MFLKTRFSRTAALTAVAWLLAQAPSRAADYIVGIGDVLTLAVPGLSIDRKMSVGVDGRIAVPLVGDIEASGKTLSQLRDSIRQVLPTKIYTQRLADGREIGTVISADEISLFVSDYRPVFVMGDVTGPGEKSFRPGMIVQQLVSMAGGFNLAQFRLENPYLSLADYRSDYDAVWNDVIRLRARVGWLRNALAIPALPAETTVQKSPLTPALTSQIVQLQESELEARAERFRKERQGLETVAKRIAERVNVLDRQREKEEEGAEFDASEERRIKDLVRSGNAAANRGAEVRRLGLLSATRALQVGSQAEAERKSQTETLNQIEKLGSDYKIDLNSELQTLSLELSKAVSRRESVWEKMVYAGAARSKLNTNQSEQIKYTISRHVDGRQVQIDATAGSEILPGDVVQVQLNLNDLIGTP